MSNPDVAHSPIGGGGRDAAFARQANLDDWRSTGRFPTIHNLMFAAFTSFVYPPDGAVLDLGCSTGLLGRRIATTGTPVVWADGDADATQRGIQAGSIDPERLWLGRFTPDTWPGFCTWLAEQNVRVVVARRILCVLSDAVPTDMVRDGFRDAGVTEVLLEGQKVDKRSVQRNARADDQASYLAPVYEVRRSPTHDIRHLVARG